MNSQIQDPYMSTAYKQKTVNVFNGMQATAHLEKYGIAVQDILEFRVGVILLQNLLKLSKKTFYRFDSKF